MKGLQKKVVVGFMSIVLLLAFSGVISLFELSHLSRDAGVIFNVSKRNNELAREMFDAAQEQHNLLLHITVFGQKEYEAACRESMRRLEAALDQAREEALDATFLDSLSLATTRLAQVVEDYLTFGVDAGDPPLAGANPDALWYSQEYEAAYRKLTDAVKNYMTSTQGSLAPRTEQLQANAYRAVAPVFVSLLVTILIVLMLLYFVSVYLVRPLVRMNKSLEDHLKFNLPFAVKGDYSDELLALKDKIEVLIALSKKKKDEPKR